MRVPAIAVLAATLCATSLHADIIARTSGTAAFPGFGVAADNGAAPMSFAFVSPGNAVLLTSVDVALTWWSNDQPTVEMQLRSDSAGLPGALVASLGSHLVNTSSATTYTFTPAAPILLPSSTPYFFSLRCIATCSGLAWTVEVTAAPSVTGMPGADLPPGLYSDSALVISDYSVLATINGSGSRFGGGDVPEPSTTALFALGLATAMLKWRKSAQ